MALIQFPEGIVFEKGIVFSVVSHDVETGKASLKSNGIIFKVDVKESEEGLIDGASIRINAEIDGFYKAEVVQAKPAKPKEEPKRAGCNSNIDKSRLFG